MSQHKCHSSQDSEIKEAFRYEYCIFCSNFKNDMTLVKSSDGRNEEDEMYSYSLSDYEATYSILKKVMLIVGIRLTREDSNFVRYLWNSFYYFEIVNLVISGTSEIINMVLACSRGSFMDVIEMTPCVGYMLMAILKSHNIVYCRPIFENLIIELRGMWPDRSISKEEHVIISSAMNRLNSVTKGYFACNAFLTFIFTTKPFWRILKRLLGSDEPLILAFLFWLPFDPIQPGFYQLMLFVQTWEAYVTVWCQLCGDLLFYVLLSHITTQFDLLVVRINKMFYVPVDRQLPNDYPLGKYDQDKYRSHYIENTPNLPSIGDTEWEDLHTKELSNILTRHRALIRLSADMEKMFSFSMLINFINSSVIICLCGFCCVMVEKWNEMIYKSFLASSISQIWLLSWYGQKLLDSSTGVSSALYNSGWYTTSGKIKKCILIMMHRSQKEVRVTTYGFSVMSLATYSTIIKTAWSYFTLLVNMYKQ